MIDLDELLRADAERWNRTRPTPDLDGKLAVAVTSGGRSHRFLAPALAAAVVLIVVACLMLTGAFRHSRSGTRPQPPAGTVVAPTKALDRITGVLWKDPHSYGTVVYEPETVRVFDGCTGTLSVLRVADHTLTPTRRITSLGVCSGGGFYAGGSGASSVGPSPEDLALHHFYQVIRGPASWYRHGNVLVLTTPDQGSLRLTTDNEPAPEAIGTPWKLINYMNTDGAEHPYHGSTGLHIAVDGSFVAGTGCGELHGTSTVTASTITFHPGNSRPCPAGPVAAVVTSLLNGPAHYIVRGNELIISDTDGRLLIYQPAGTPDTGAPRTTPAR